MKSRFSNFETAQHRGVPQLSLDQRRQQLEQWMDQCRSATLRLFEGVDPATFCCQAHPEFSPVGWHLGHIAFTEAHWILRRCAGSPPLFPEYQRLFAADGLPKTERVFLPTLPEIRSYLDSVRTQVLDYLEIAPLDEQERLWRWLIQHESQHSETVSFILQLQRRHALEGCTVFGPEHYTQSTTFLTGSDYDMLCIPAGAFEQGNDSLDALDNERPVSQVNLETYWIDRYPVTCEQYRAFMDAGGYQNPTWWSAAGWSWLQAHPVEKPLYWVEDPAYDRHPVCGVSWYEAEAYAQFVGKRLPTEAEWEKAASWNAVTGQRQTYPWGEAFPEIQHCNCDYQLGQTTPVDAYPEGQSPYGCYDMLGNVWEWTASWFSGYEGFESYPYPGYSQVYFDQQHRVLRGGSWATRPWALRCAFRNWYHPGVRQIFIGFRCAQSS